MTETTIHFYDKREERINVATHGVAAVLAACGTVFMMLKVGTSDALTFFAMLVFCLSTVSVYAVSTTYHSSKSVKPRIAWQKADHCMVGMIIAGTSTPLLLIATRGVVGIVMLCLIWAVTAVNFALNIVSVSKYKKSSQLLYLVAVLLMVVGLSVEQPKDMDYRFIILLSAGIATLGIGWFFYFQKNRLYTHAVWHFADVACSAMHFVAFYLYFI